MEANDEAESVASNPLKDLEDSSRGALFIWFCVWISDIILGFPIEHYATFIMGASVLYTSFRNQLLTSGDLQMILGASIAIASLCYFFLSDMLIALTADLVLLGYASFTLTKADAVLMLPVLCALDTVFAPLLRFQTIANPLILCINIGIGVPLVIVSQLSEFSDTVDSEGVEGEIEQKVLESEGESVSLDIGAVSESLTTTLHLLSNYIFMGSVKLLSLASPKEGASMGVDVDTASAISSKNPEESPIELQPVLDSPTDLEVISEQPVAEHASPMAVDEEKLLEVAEIEVSEAKAQVPEEKEKEEKVRKVEETQFKERFLTKNVTVRRSTRRRRKKPEEASSQPLRRSRRTPREYVLYISGENLRPMSRWRSTIDAYVEIYDEKGNECARTNVVEDSLYPKWIPVTIAASVGERIEFRVLHMGVISSYPLGVTFMRIPSQNQQPCNLKRDLYAQGKKVMSENGNCALDISIHQATPKASRVSTFPGFTSNKDLGIYSRTRSKQKTPSRSRSPKKSGESVKVKRAENAVINGGNLSRADQLAAIKRLQIGSLGYKHTSKGRKMRWIKLSKDRNVVEWWAPDR